MEQDLSVEQVLDLVVTQNRASQAYVQQVELFDVSKESGLTSEIFAQLDDRKLQQLRTHPIEVAEVLCDPGKAFLVDRTSERIRKLRGRLDVFIQAGDQLHTIKPPAFVCSRVEVQYKNSLAYSANYLMDGVVEQIELMGAASDCTVRIESDGSVWLASEQAKFGAWVDRQDGAILGWSSWASPDRRIEGRYGWFEPSDICRGRWPRLRLISVLSDPEDAAASRFSSLAVYSQPVSSSELPSPTFEWSSYTNRMFDEAEGRTYGPGNVPVEAGAQSVSASDRRDAAAASMQIEQRTLDALTRDPGAIVLPKRRPPFHAPTLGVGIVTAGVGALLVVRRRLK